MARRTQTAFLDANVLAAPVTRTLVLVGIESVGVAATWSEHAEGEANRHMRSRAMSITALRTTLLETELSPAGDNPGRFPGTKDADRQIVADAVAADAAFLITTDVDDFGELDLVKAGIAAVNPDLFMSLRFTAVAYQQALSQLVASLAHPPKSTEQMHVLIGRQHPRLQHRFSGMFPNSTPDSSQPVPRVLYRGARGVICGRQVHESTSLTLGCHAKCHKRLDPADGPGSSVRFL